MSTTAAPARQKIFADKIKMQHRLFAELSAMFGREVPLYDKSLLVNRECNKTVCALLAKQHPGFTLSDEQLDKTSGERHGAIRIGKPDEYRWIAGFFAAFGMEPHNFYDMTSLGGKSQPIIATAFRSPVNPEHRIFCSLLTIESFDLETRQRVETLLAPRQVFSERAKELVLRNEEQGGLDEADGDDLIREGTTRIFKWTAQAREYQLYKDLSDAGFKIAADIACFGSHHLNHLTPNTFCMDLYTAAMKHCLGEWDAPAFRHRAAQALTVLRGFAGRDYMKLHFRHLTSDDIEQFGEGTVSDADIAQLAGELTARLGESDLDLSALKHSGFKDFTEGPDVNTPVLLRQDAYKALTEPVTFQNSDGTTLDTVHTARFGEIEQRFYATTPAGRELYDRCLNDAEAERAKNPNLVKEDFDAYQSSYASAFTGFPKTLGELLEARLVYGRYSVTAKGAASQGAAGTTDIDELARQGYVRYEGLRYEDFLPFSAAGIFASNLGQYGTKTAEKPTYTAANLETIMGRPIIDPNTVYYGMQSRSLLDTYRGLGLLDQLPAAEKAELERSVAASDALLAGRG